MTDQEEFYRTVELSTENYEVKLPQAKPSEHEASRSSQEMLRKPNAKEIEQLLLNAGYLPPGREDSTTHNEPRTKPNAKEIEQLLTKAGYLPLTQEDFDSFNQPKQKPDAKEVESLLSTAGYLPSAQKDTTPSKEPRAKPNAKEIEGLLFNSGYLPSTQENKMSSYTLSSDKTTSDNLKPPSSFNRTDRPDRPDNKGLESMQGHLLTDAWIDESISPVTYWCKCESDAIPEDHPNVVAAEIEDNMRNFGILPVVTNTSDDATSPTSPTMNNHATSAYTYRDRSRSSISQMVPTFFRKLSMSSSGKGPKEDKMHRSRTFGQDKLGDGRGGYKRDRRNTEWSTAETLVETDDGQDKSLR